MCRVCEELSSVISDSPDSCKLSVHLMPAEEKICQSGKYYSAQTVYDHSRRRQSHLYIPYAVCNVGCKMKLRYFSGSSASRCTHKYPPEFVDRNRGTQRYKNAVTITT